MRKLVSYLYRRGIRDSKACAEWAESNSFTSIEDINTFCSSRGLEIRDEQAFRDLFSFLFETSPVAKEEGPSEKKTAQPSSKAWHVPAAERPLSKTAPTSKPKRKRRARKPAPVKDEK